MKTRNTMIALVAATIFTTTVSAQYMAGNRPPQDRNVVVLNTPAVKVIKQDFPGWRNDKKIIVVNNNGRNECLKHHRRNHPCAHQYGGYKPPRSCNNNGRFDRKW